MEKEFNNENTLETVENTEAVTEQASGDVKDPPKSAWKAYVPRFTEASERYRVKGDSRIRERFGIKTPVAEIPETNPDEIKLDATAEFDEDFMGSDAKAPEKVAVDESDESISVMKFKSPEDELEEEAEREREAIKKLLGDSKPKAEPEPEEEPVEEVVEEAPVEEPAPIEEENPFVQPMGSTRRIDLDELKFGRNYGRD